MTAEEAARWIANEIIGELKGRRGLRHEWEAIDDECKEEIAVEWAKIARLAILARERAARVEAWMPIHSTPFAIRMSALSEEWAQRNHGQSLGQLAERGGLDLAEAASIVESRPYYPRTAREAIHAINDWLAARAEEEGRG